MSSPKVGNPVSMARTDDDSWGVTESVGQTALGVALSRAHESASEHPLFTDPYAQLFIDAATGADWQPPNSMVERIRSIGNYAASRTKWFEYSRARDMMLKATDTKWAPWHILRSDDKQRARLNCITQLLELIPYKKVPRDKIKLPDRSMKDEYDDQAALKGRKFVPEIY